MPHFTGDLDYFPHLENNPESRTLISPRPLTNTSLNLLLAQSRVKSREISLPVCLGVGAAMPRDSSRDAGPGAPPLTPIRHSRPGLGANAFAGFGTFIVSNNLEKPDAQTRRFIRSYVMRGKNRRRPKGRRATDGEAAAKRNVLASQPPASNESLDCSGWIALPPQKFYTELSFLGFGDDIQPYMKVLIHKGMALRKPSKCRPERVTRLTPDQPSPSSSQQLTPSTTSSWRPPRTTSTASVA